MTSEEAKKRLAEIRAVVEMSAAKDARIAELEAELKDAYEVGAAQLKSLAAEEKRCDELEAENAVLKTHLARTQEACKIFEANSADVVAIWEQSQELRRENAQLRQSICSGPCKEHGDKCPEHGVKGDVCREPEVRG